MQLLSTNKLKCLSSTSPILLTTLTSYNVDHRIEINNSLLAIQIYVYQHNQWRILTRGLMILLVLML
jgi:hypothetical protein